MTPTTPTATPAVRTRGLVKGFGSNRAVDHVDLEVARGEIVGVLGPNGAGKTTTLRMLATLLPVDSGTAEVFGVDVMKHPHRVRQLIGLTGQYASVDEDLTARENLRMFGRLQGLPGRQHAQPGHRRGEERGEVGHGLDHLLAVVQDEQHRRSGEVSRDPGEHGARVRPLVVPLGGPVARPDRGGDGGRDVRRCRHRRERDHVHDGLPRGPRDALREGRLPEAARPQDRDDPRLLERGAHGGKVALPADERRRVLHHTGPHGTVGSQQLRVHDGERRRRVDPQSVCGAVGERGVRREGARRSVDGREGAQVGNGDVLVVGPGGVGALERLQGSASRASASRPSASRTLPSAVSRRLRSAVARACSSRSAGPGSAQRSAGPTGSACAPSPSRPPSCRAPMSATCLAAASTPSGSADASARAAACAASVSAHASTSPASSASR